MNEYSNLEDFLIEADKEEYIPYVPVKKRKLENNKNRNADEDIPKQKTLLERNLEIKKIIKSVNEIDAEKELKFLDSLKSNSLFSLNQASKDSVNNGISTSWKPLKRYINKSEKEIFEIREKHNIKVEGTDVPCPINSFKNMKFPKPIIKYLKSKNITKPTLIQMQGLPVALSGRDMIGIAFTGSGKTLSFCLPLVMLALEEETKLPYLKGEGPTGLIIVPSRELARQIYEEIKEISKMLYRKGYKEIRTLLCIGGISMMEQANVLNNGFHIVVATPGRLQDMLEKKKFNLNLCKYLCLDEADRMIDLGFEQDIKNILSFLNNVIQTVLFSATMPLKILQFAQSSLINPVIINIGRAGSANLDVVQEVEFVKEENKKLYLLDCLQKTAPPVLIFAENKNDVDDIYEYLLLRGVEATSIHGGKTQEEREYAIKSFKTFKKDVLVATDIASKGLDFANVKHVINYDMPKEIEDYVHRIGRTGRSGKTGLSTTFVNNLTMESILLDLKYLLIESKQKIPKFLLNLYDPSLYSNSDSCAYCGGLAHKILDCPKLDAQRRSKMTSSNKMDTGTEY